MKTEERPAATGRPAQNKTPGAYTGAATAAVVQVADDQWITLEFAAADPQMRAEAAAILERRQEELRIELARIGATLQLLGRAGAP